MTSIAYMQAGFWDKLVSDMSREGIRTMLNVSDALGNSVVITDVPEEQIQKDTFLMVLIKQGNYKRCDSNYINKKIDGLNSSSSITDLCATYMLNKSSSDCDVIENKYGIVVLCANTLSDKRYLFVGDGISLNKNNRYPKKYVTFQKQLQLPCNSLIVIDPYILAKQVVDQNTGKTLFPGLTNNLEPLLDSILPQSLSINFHLSIISCLDNPDNLKELHEKIRACLKHIRPNLHVELGLFYTGKGYRHNIESFHSRHIITNSFIIDSEDGLDLFNDIGYIQKNNPTLSIVFPRLFGNSRQDMTKYDRWVKSVKRYIEECSEKLHCGTKENRLFELFDEQIGEANPHE